MYTTGYSQSARIVTLYPLRAVARVAGRLRNVRHLIVNGHDDASSRTEASVIAGSVNRTRMLLARTTGFAFIDLKHVYRQIKGLIDLRVYSP